MQNLIIFLAQTKSEATIEILLLLLVAAIIGYITAWLYCKSNHAINNNAANINLENLVKQNETLTADKTNLNLMLHKQIIKTEHMIMEVNALKSLHAEAVQETDDMSLQNRRSEQLLYEKDEALVHIIQCGHLLDYNSFGTATVDEKDDLKMISGIGPFVEERLHALNIYTFRQISKFTKRDIDTINDAIEYFSGRIHRDEWVAQAKELLHNKDKRTELFKRISNRKFNIYYNRIGVAHEEEGDDLTIISGIGGWIQEKLNALDIYTYKQISNFTKEDVYTITEAIEYFPGRIERDEWILQAKDLIRIAGKKAELHLRIKEKRERIFYDRLGIAHKHQANNLTLINGIGLWIEERLNMLDIYTFEQISKLTHEDVETITEILEISPGRIDQDNWVSQAHGFVIKKQVDQVLI
jgi:predicted flap endonuclease-1-like 5' DNA nuclease